MGVTVAAVEEIRMKKVAIAGANGFIGKALQEDFRHTVILHRDDTVEMLREKLIDVDMVINLAGAPIVKRWSEDYKKILVQSRIETTAKLVEAMDGSDVAYFISASAIGIYPNDTRCDERCDMFGEDSHGSSGIIGDCPGDHMIESRPQRIDIGTTVQFFFGPGLFRTQAPPHNQGPRFRCDR